MTRRTSRNHSDPRIGTFTHRGNTVTVRLISPEVSPDGRHIRRDAPVIHEGGPLDGKSVIVRGWLLPSTFEVTGIGNLIIRFTLAASNPLTRVPLVIDAMEITNAGTWRPAWNTADIPHDKLEREAMTLASVWIRRKLGPPFVGRVHINAKMTLAQREAAMAPITRAYGTNEVIGLAAAITQYDLDKLRGKRPRGRAPWDSAEVLREVAATTPPRNRIQSAPCQSRTTSAISHSRPRAPCAARSPRPANAATSRAMTRNQTANRGANDE